MEIALEDLKSGHFSKCFLTQRRPFVWVSNGGLPDFRSHSKSGQFANQPLYEHLKSVLDQILDPYFILEIIIVGKKMLM